MKKINKLKNTFLSRNTALTKLAFKTGKDLIFSRDELKDRIQNTLTNHMDLLSNELSMMKGSVMKAGQMLSLVAGDLLPDDFKQFFEQLESKSHYLDWSEVKKQVPEKFFNLLEIDSEPFAAASIGQVHKAIVKETGKVLALKIQYPGVREAIDHDIRMLKLIMKMAKVIPKSVDSNLVFDEVKKMLYQEMNYATELELTIKYRDLAKEIPEVQIVEPVLEFCSDKIFASEFVECSNLTDLEALNLSLEQRNKIGIDLLNLYFLEVFHWGVIQTDGNKGNFKIVSTKEGNKLFLLDFGATKIVPEDVLNDYQNLIRGCIKSDRNLFFESAKNLGYFQGEVDKEYFWEYATLLATPFHSKKYDWGNSDIPEKVMEYIPKTIQKMPKGRPNGVAVYLDRKIVGVFFILKTLGCHFEIDAVENLKFV